jgi:hypothetical protein
MQKRNKREKAKKKKKQEKERKRKKKKKENAVCDGSLLLFLLIPNCCALKKYKMCRKKD